MNTAQRIAKRAFDRGCNYCLATWHLKGALIAFVSLLMTLPVYSDFKPTQKTADVTPVIATFANNVGDRVRSDAGGAYLDGVDGVHSLIDLLDDFILQLNGSGKRNAPRRQLFFDFNEPVVASGAVALGTLYDDAFLNVDSIGTLAVGESRPSQAQFNTEFGLLRFNPVNYPGTSYVLVTRLSETSWVITSSQDTGGDVAALVQQSKRNTFRHVGNYHMPFRVNVQLQ